MTSDARVENSVKGTSRSTLVRRKTGEPKNHNMPSEHYECKACQIVLGERPTPGGLIAENKYWHATHIGEPAALIPGMVTVRAKRHVLHLADLTDSEIKTASLLISGISKAIMRVLAPERVYCIFFGEGTPHAHFSLIPRYADMPAGDPVAVLSDIMVVRKHTIPLEEAAKVALCLKEEVANEKRAE